MSIRIQFESGASWIVNAAGYIISTEPEVTELTGSRVTNTLKKLKEGDKLTIIRNSEASKHPDKVLTIQHLD